MDQGERFDADFLAFYFNKFADDSDGENDDDDMQMIIMLLTILMMTVILSWLLSFAAMNSS